MSDDKIVHVGIKSDIEGSYARMWLSNLETGEEITRQDTLRLFDDIRITGVCVMNRLPPADDFPENAPFAGVITEITDTEVHVGTYVVPKDKFHDWYIID